MHERIKQIRKNLGMTQQEFADRLNVSRSNIANYENGSRAPIDAMVNLMCREFDISEAWLRTGEGEMLQPISRDEEIAAFMGDVMRGETPDFRRRLIAVLAKLEPVEWELLGKMAQRLADECKEGQA